MFVVLHLNIIYLYYLFIYNDFCIIQKIWLNSMALTIQ